MIITFVMLFVASSRARIAAMWVAVLPVMFGQSVPLNSYLELDGNSTVQQNDDWDRLNGNGSGNGVAGSSMARSFVSGSASIPVFTGGGSKDPLDVTQWKWKVGGTPDKDALTNGYVAAYRGLDGHAILAFGADRYSTNGDANIGFWFFQQDVHPDGTGTSGAGSPFTGRHVNGDLLVVSTFTQGGGVANMSVYAWDSSCLRADSNLVVGACADTNLRVKFLKSGGAGSCAAETTGCADVNPQPITVSWPYLAKFGIGTNVIPTGGFYEGALDLTTIFGSAAPCYASFVMETRTSQSTTATLKDLLAGPITMCTVSTTQSCAGNGVLNAAGTSIRYTYGGTVTKSNVNTLTNVTLIDSLPTGSTNAVVKVGGTPVSLTTCPTGSPAGSLCAVLGNLSGDTTLDWTVEFDSTQVSVQGSATVRASTTGGSPGACGTAGTLCSAPAGEACTTVTSNQVSISKTCGIAVDYPNGPAQGTQLALQSGMAVVKMYFSGEISNTGDTPLTNVTVTNSPTANVTVAWPGTVGTIPRGGSVKYSGSFTPSTFDGDGTGIGRYGFSDEIKVTGATASIGSSPGTAIGCVSPFASGSQACAATTCNICPSGATCAGK